MNAAMMSSAQQSAQFFWNHGFSVVPVHWRSKQPEATWAEYQTRQATEYELKTWFAGALHNVGVVTGFNRLLVLDFDEMRAYLKWLVWSATVGGLAGLVGKSAFRVRTNRGMHVYLRSTAPMHTRKVGPIDIRAEHAMVIGPGSVHPSGTMYEAELHGRFLAPLISTLDQVLPARLLVAETVLPDAVAIPGAPAKKVLSDDPWAVAAGDAQASADLVGKVREAFRIEEFFVARQPTSADGRWQVTLCPFHGDVAPSLWIDTKRQVCGCFAGCMAKPYDVINLYGRLYGLDNRQALLELGRRL